VPLLGGAILLAAGFAGAAAPALARVHTAARTAAPVKTTVGHILVTPKGKTLYVFAADSKNKSTCYGSCAKFWPPRHVAAGSTPPAKISGIPGTFGVITRTDGTRQLTYDGAPLYTFAGDKKLGDMNGQGLDVSGGYWWAVVAGGS
jgi:predicted lipoprotein with Yx(FWY)xxD motif